MLTVKRKNMKHHFLSVKKSILASIIVTGTLLAGCGGSGDKSAKDSSATSFGANSDANTLLGAGSTFVYPLFSKLFSVYGQETGVKVNYQSIGSGGGILQLTNKTIDFGDSDAPLNDDQAKKNGRRCFAYPHVFRRGSDQL